ncbi:MAG: hypothetical protein CMD68_01900 [Gammaproteobacteria bacterium]|nr:hypothetical protein [Gammaproteobacteria bacterium]|tara:strand:- start:594 stop:923 length:330 start_codon:yes stop_codon:yes gene_type:complete
MKLLNIFGALFLLVFISSCGSDPEVDAVVEKLSSEEDWSKSDIKCYVKAIKKGLTDDQWDQFLVMSDVKEEEKKSDVTMDDIGKAMGETFAMMPVIMASAVKCGIPMDM